MNCPTTYCKARFLLPALQIDHVLEQTTVEQIRKALSNVPSALADNFDLTIRRINNQGLSQSSLAMSTLLWLSHVRRPLKLLELQHALGTTIGSHRLSDLGLADLDFFVAYCLGLVVYDSTTLSIRFVHQSVNEYINQKQPPIFPNAEKTLAVTCLTYLLLDDIHPKLDNNSAFLNYAVHHWGDHAKTSFDTDVERLSFQFLQTQSALDIWCEAAGDILEGEGNHPVHVATVFGLETLVLAFIELGNEINATNSRGETPLMLAAKFGHEEIVSLLMSRRNLLKNAQTNEGLTALCHAVENDRVQIVQLLIQHPDVDVNLGRPIDRPIGKVIEKDDIIMLLLKRSDLDINSKRSSIGRTPLWNAVIEGRPKLVHQILSRIDLDPLPESGNYGLDKNNNHPIHIAVIIWIEDNHIMTPRQVMDTLLILDVVLNDARVSVGAYKYVRIIYTWYVFDKALHNETGLVMKVLIENGINAFFTDEHGRTFLFSAMDELVKDEDHKLHAEENVRTLLDMGLDPNAAERNGWTPLHEAAQPRREIILEMLIEKGATTTASTDTGWTVLHEAVDNGCESAVGLLLQHGADANARLKASEGWSILHGAVRSGNEAIVKLLLKYGADVSAKTSEGTTVLHTAIGSEKRDMFVPWLLKNGADTTAANVLGDTSLHHACSYCSKEVCLMLLDKGAQLDKVSFFGYGSTALALATRSLAQNRFGLCFHTTWS